MSMTHLIKPQSTFKGAVVLKKIRNWTIERAINPRTGRRMIVVVGDVHSDYPLKYPSTGQVAYDFPERIPKDVKRAVEKMM